MSAEADSPSSAGDGRPSTFSGRTAWARSLQTPLREFLQTETGGAAVLLAAAVAALVWVNVDASSYESLWETTLSIDVGDAGISLDLREWVNSGLMTFFFFVVGLEARREFDLGELRERRRFALPLLAASAAWRWRSRSTSPSTPASPSAHGWGVAMSTDTAFALGLLALVGPRFPDRLRAFMLTVVVVDDIVALVVIATVYTEDVDVAPLLVAVALLRRHARRAPHRASGRAPLLRCSASPSGSRCSSRASSRSSSASRWACSRSPTRRRGRASSARPSASASSASSRRPSWRARPAQELRSAISPNERLQQLFHPWTSYVIVPLFALANAGIALDGAFLRRGGHLADHARDPRRLRGRQAGRHPRRLVAARRG